MVKTCKACYGRGRRPTWQDAAASQPEWEWAPCPQCSGKGRIAEKGDKTVPIVEPSRDPEQVPATTPEEAEKVSRHNRRVTSMGVAA